MSEIDVALADLEEAIISFADEYNRAAKCLVREVVQHAADDIVRAYIKNIVCDGIIKHDLSVYFKPHPKNQIHPLNPGKKRGRK